MYTISGSVWQPLSTNAHAANILANMNSQLQSQGLPVLTATTGNVLWFYCLAAAQDMATNIDIPLTAAKNSFDLTLCDDNQLYNLLPLTGTSLIPASYTTVYATFTASAGGTLIVPSGTLLNASGIATQFATQGALSIPANTSQNVSAIATIPGSVIVISGQITSAATGLTNLASVTNNTPGQTGTPIETAVQLRARLIAGKSVGNNLDGLTRALRALPGITNANVFFNYNLTSLSLSGVTSGITLPPRNAYMIVTGSSNAIGATYWGLMNAPTYGSQAQTVVTLSNQSMTINYDYAIPQNVYLQVSIQQSSIINAGYLQALILAIQAIIPAPGKPLTSAYMLSQLTGYTAATIEGLLLSLTPSNYTVAVNIGANAYAQFLANNISVVLL